MSNKRNFFEILGFQDNNGDGKTNFADVFSKKPTPKPDDSKDVKKWLVPVGVSVAVIGGGVWLFSGGKPSGNKRRRR